MFEIELKNRLKGDTIGLYGPYRPLRSPKGDHTAGEQMPSSGPDLACNERTENR